MKTVKVDIRTQITHAANIIAPLWPMQTIIARNPLQGIESMNFEDAIAVGEHFFSREETNVSAVNREMIKWCQAFLDEGQATITMPERDKGFYRAWAILAPFDKKLHCKNNTNWLRSLPSDPEETISRCLKQLNISEDQTETYLKHSLAELPGWAGYIKWREEWQKQSEGSKNPITLIDYLAVRLAITCALDEPLLQEKRKHSTIFTQDFFKELEKKETQYLHSLLKLVIPKVVKLSEREEKKYDAQLVFCIDVRSEPFRRQLERQGNYETFGFAGFFGLPVSIRNYDTGQVKACCPVLLKPHYEVDEEPLKKESCRIAHHKKGRKFLNLFRRFYQDLKYNFATPFALVETLGLWCGMWMAIRTLLPVKSVEFRQGIREKLSPTLATLPKINIPLADQVMYAESALRMMGLTKNFSSLIVLCGHGSQTENNPYASALDCGACGGNHGGPNGKILAAILNSNEVRGALLKKGIIIPNDTVFIGAEHHTTTDDVLIDDHPGLDNTSKKILETLKADLIRAGTANSQYRCHAFGRDASPSKAKSHVLRRSSDWAEVRPEWGLARNAAFIIGPRMMTKDLDLEGRCFLHSYDWKEDREGRSLETILTAPMVVAEWINTQYFFSTINNRTYGSGSKITHNVTGKLGVMQGNGSDLMQGLPLQSVNSSDDYSYHESLRLQVIVFAPRSRIDKIIEEQSILQTLLFNHWVILIAIDPTDSIAYRLMNKAEWKEIMNAQTLCGFFH